MKVDLTNLHESLGEIISSYADDVKQLAENKLDETADKILDYIIKNCPRSNLTGEHLATSFVKTISGKNEQKVIYISSKTKSGLVHLIELGFRHRSGKQVQAKPFLRPAFDSFTPQMLDDIRKIINGG